MMNPAAATAADALFDVVIQIHSRLGEVESLLQEQFGETTTRSGYDARLLQDWSERALTVRNLEAYVEADLPSGRTLFWRTELTRDQQGWQLHCVLEQPAKYGAQSVRSFPAVVASTADELLVKLPPLMNEFVESVTDVVQGLV